MIFTLWIPPLSPLLHTHTHTTTTTTTTTTTYLPAVAKRREYPNRIPSGNSNWLPPGGVFWLTTHKHQLFIDGTGGAVIPLLESIGGFSENQSTFPSFLFFIFQFYNEIYFFSFLFFWTEGECWRNAGGWCGWHDPWTRLRYGAWMVESHTERIKLNRWWMALKRGDKFNQWIIAAKMDTKWIQNERSGYRNKFMFFCLYFFFFFYYFLFFFFEKRQTKCVCLGHGSAGSRPNFLELNAAIGPEWTVKWNGNYYAWNSDLFTT